MAIWQFDLYFLPASKIEEKGLRLASHIDEVAFTSTDWWSGMNLAPDCCQVLDSILPRSLSWDKDRLSWGKEDSHTIQVIRDETGKINEFWVRIDLREPSEVFIKHIIGAAQTCNCLIFVSESNRLLPPSYEGIVQEIQSSRSYSFVIDPKKHLDRLATKLAASQKSKSSEEVGEK
jgi:rhodanese-related sulfurtransferase